MTTDLLLLGLLALLLGIGGLGQYLFTRPPLIPVVLYDEIGPLPPSGNEGERKMTKDAYDYSRRNPHLTYTRINQLMYLKQEREQVEEWERSNPGMPYRGLRITYHR